MKTLYYKGFELDEDKTKRNGYPYGNFGIFAYNLKDNENEKEVRDKIEKRCIGNVGSTEILTPEIFQLFPINMSKTDIEKNTKYRKIKSFCWLN